MWRSLDEDAISHAGAMVIFPRNKIIVPRKKIFVPMKNIFVPIIKMRSALLDDDVDTGAGGDGSLHFYPPLPLNHLATFVRSELCNPAKHFSATFSQTRLLSTPP